MHSDSELLQIYLDQNRRFYSISVYRRDLTPFCPLKRDYLFCVTENFTVHIFRETFQNLNHIQYVREEIKSVHLTNDWYALLPFAVPLAALLSLFLGIYFYVSGWLSMPVIGYIIFLVLLLPFAFLLFSKIFYAKTLAIKLREGKSLHFIFPKFYQFAHSPAEKDGKRLLEFLSSIQN